MNTTINQIATYANDAANAVVGTGSQAISAVSRNRSEIGLGLAIAGLAIAAPEVLLIQAAVVGVAATAGYVVNAFNKPSHALAFVICE
jgi:hypothetical protein